MHYVFAQVFVTRRPTHLSVRERECVCVYMCVCVCVYVCVCVITEASLRCITH